ncbi:MAG: dioxygenase [Betaproteobacteria bacterium]|jgi:protocatechuate 3,4-dioxygenase beta subunit|nr:hydroxyquinol 1,2-dioxygenase [Betaproteobacteria bacterium]
MRDVDSNTITAAVVRSFDGAADPRLREIIASLVRHLHGFARETRLTPEEWQAGLDFLHRAARISNESRSEFVLTSDILGLSSLVDLIASGKGGTERSALGPFHAEGSPLLEVGGDLKRDNAGEPMLVSGRVLDTAGRPVPRAQLDFWQAAVNGKYWQQDPEQNPDNLRFRMLTRDDGAYSFTTVRPAPYTVPYDGPVGELLRAAGRHAWRPAHFHFIVSAEGHHALTTEVFFADDPYIDGDAVFGVRESLLVQPQQNHDGELARRHGLPLPFEQVIFDFRLAPAPG